MYLLYPSGEDASDVASLAGRGSWCSRRVPGRCPEPLLHFWCDTWLWRLSMNRRVGLGWILLTVLLLYGTGMTGAARLFVGP